MPQVLTITIPRTLARRGELVVIPRREYETLRAYKKIGEFTPSASEKKALARAERNFRLGKTLSYHELVSRLGVAR